MRILITLLYYLPHRTGMQTYIQRMAEALVARSHEVTLLVAWHDRSVPREETVAGVRIVRVPVLPLRLSRGRLMPGYPMALWRLARTHDVISAHVPMLEAPMIAAVSKLQRKPLVVTHHGDLRLPAGAANRVIERMVFAGYRTLAAAAHRIVAYSEDYARHSSWLVPYAAKTTPIAPPIVIPLPEPGEVARLRAELAPDGGPLIGFAGRFVEEKRPDLVIRALEIIRKQRPHARVAFAGEHRIPYEDTWARHAGLTKAQADGLIFLGLKDDPRFMANFYAACDVLALPSDGECFGLVQVEAMLCGTPAVMADTPGGRVPVKATGMGLITPRGDAEALARSLLEVIDRREVYVKPRETIERAFPMEATVEAYERLFAEAAAR
ncbi:MAG: glycosyltransferase family 4 protein [Parvibaculaceae bacterium]